jgi:hypothetical protein
LYTDYEFLFQNELTGITTITEELRDEVMQGHEVVEDR